MCLSVAYGQKPGCFTSYYQNIPPPPFNLWPPEFYLYCTLVGIKCRVLWFAPMESESCEKREKKKSDLKAMHLTCEMQKCH